MATNLERFQLRRLELVLERRVECSAYSEALMLDRAIVALLGACEDAGVRPQAIEMIFMHRKRAAKISP